MSQLPPPPPPPPPPPSGWGPPSAGRGGWAGPTQYAGFGIRLAGYLIDGILLSIPNAIVQSAVGQIAGFVFSLALGIGYAIYFIGSPSGQTVGMRLLKIRVIDANTGGRVDYSRCVVRYLVSIVSGLALLLGYFWMLWDPRKQTWQDKAAGTVVVPVTLYPVDKWPG
jgi:uncharacterized RDD family membrane protein YckC